MQQSFLLHLFLVFLFRDGVDLGEIVRSFLVHEVVDPVGVQEVCAGAPGVRRPFGDTVVREVVHRFLDGEAGVEVPLVLVVQRVGVVLGVTGDEDLSAVFRRDGEDTGLLRGGEDF